MKSAPKKDHSIVETVFLKSTVTFILNTTVWVTLVDGAVIGNFLGPDAVAAYGLAWPMVLLFGLVTAVFSGGTRTLYAHFIGQGDIKEANKTYTIAFISAVVVSIVIIVLTLLFSDGIASLLGASGKNAHLSPLVSSYIRGFVFEVPFFSLGGILSALVVIDSDFKRAFYARITMSIFDIAGDLIAVLCFGGGMFMLGFTTAIAQLSYFIVMCTHFAGNNRILRFETFRPGELFFLLKQILSNGLPSGLTSVSGAIGGIISNRIITAFATGIYVVAFSVHKSVGSMMGVAYMCIADAVWTLSGIFYGEEDAKALGELQRTALKKGLLFNCVAAVIVLLFSKYFALLFLGKSDAETLLLSMEAVQVLAISLPVFMLVYSAKNYLMGVGRRLEANIYSVLSECIFQIFSVYLMVGILGGRGAWFATPVRLLILLLIFIMYVLFWGKGNSFREKCLLLPAGFSNPGDKEMSITVNSMDGVMTMSEAAGDFCKENGINDTKKINALMLCIEEVGGNIINHGFNDRKKHSIDLRILIKEDRLILRLRDDCLAFNPIEYYEMTRTHKSGEKTGLRIVMAKSRDVKYINSVGTNNLIITI